MRNRIAKRLLAVILLLIVGSIAINARVTGANATPDKSDSGECTGGERVGRCADKCPSQTDTLLGYANNGIAICRSAPTGCPYGDSIPLGAECDKHAPSQEQGQQGGWGK